MPIITLNTKRFFEAKPAASILDAALSAGIVLEYSCRTGRCGTCKAPLTSGETVTLRPETSLPAEDVQKGLILTCCRAAVSDVTLDIEPLDRLAELEIKTIPARIVSIDRLAPTIIKVVLRTPPSSSLRFLPGQYVDVIVNGIRRSYSLANAPRADGLLELLIKHYAGGELSRYWFERAQPGDLLRIEGPLGTFFLREEAPTNILFLATGTGIAPVRALLQELAATPERAAQHSIRVFWGNRDAENFVWEPDELAIDLRFHRLVSGAGGDWSGARGHVHTAAIMDGVDTAQTVVYACGSDAMIASAREALCTRGLPPRRFLSDAFVSSN